MKLTLISYAIGLIVGLIIAVVRTYQIPILSQVFAVFITIYQGIPTVVALLIYNLIFLTTFNSFASTFHLGITLADVDSIIVGYFALSLFCITSISETFRGALKSIPQIQYEAGYSIGLTKLQTLRRIIIPQVIPVAMPGLTNNMVGAIKATALVTAVGIVEVMSGAVIPCGITYSYMEGYTAAAVVYWVFSEIIGILFRIVEKRSNRYIRRGTA
jgi:L-cystine transport system permease protein